MQLNSKRRKDVPEDGRRFAGELVNVTAATNLRQLPARKVTRNALVRSFTDRPDLTLSLSFLFWRWESVGDGKGEGEGEGGGGL